MSTPAEITERIAAIRQRLESATPGPWIAVLSATVMDSYSVLTGDFKTRVAADVFDAGCIDREDDALLIAHAPEDLWWALDQLEEARASVTRCQNCGKMGLPSPTVVLDLEEELRQAQDDLVRARSSSRGETQP